MNLFPYLSAIRPPMGILVEGKMRGISLMAFPFGESVLYWTGKFGILF